MDQQQRERLQTFCRDVVRERMRLSCMMSAIHQLWTAFMLTVVMSGAMTSFVFLLNLGVTVVDIARGRPVDVWERLGFIGTFAVVAAVFCGIVALLVCIAFPFSQRRPHTVLAGSGRLLAIYPNRKLRIPLSECVWKRTRLGALDPAGILFDFRPHIQITWIPDPPENGDRIQPTLITIGLSPKTYQKWETLFERERIRRSQPAIQVSVLWAILIGGLLGFLVGWVAAGFIILCGGDVVLAFGIVLLAVIDGAYVVAMHRYVAIGEIRMVRLIIGKHPRSQMLLIGLGFAAATMRLFRGMGFPIVLMMAAINGGLAAFLFWTVLGTYRKRIKAEPAATDATLPYTSPETELS